MIVRFSNADLRNLICKILKVCPMSNDHLFDRVNSIAVVSKNKMRKAKLDLLESGRITATKNPVIYSLTDLGDENTNSLSRMPRRRPRRTATYVPLSVVKNDTIRPGSLDYMNYPSLIGGTHTPYHVDGNFDYS